MVWFFLVLEEICVYAMWLGLGGSEMSMVDWYIRRMLLGCWVFWCYGGIRLLLCGFLERLCGCGLGVFVSGGLGVWVHGCMGVWVHGCMLVWVRVYVRVCAWAVVLLGVFMRERL